MSDIMNIAMFVDSYKPQINGMVTSVDIFKRYLEKKDHGTYVFAPRIKGAKREAGVFRFRSIPFQAYKEYRIGVPYRIPITKRIKKINFDVVHIHSPFSMGATGIGFAKYYKLPVIGTFHTLFPDYMHYAIRVKKLQESKIVKKIFDRTSWSYLRWFYNKCDIVIAPSEEIRDVLIKRGIKKEVIAIPTGIEIKKRKPSSKKTLRKKYGFNDENIIIHVGRLSKEKNIDFIIKSLKKILKNKKAILVITSDGPYRKELEAYAKRMDLKHEIIFTGYLSERALSDYYNLADLFVLASKTETQGIVLAEAAISKLPMVILDAPVTSNFVKENDLGIISDSKNFSANVTKLLGSKSLREKYIRNSEKVEEKYNITRCTDRLLEAYEQAIAKKQ